MSRLTEAMERQEQLDKLSGKEHKDLCDDLGIAPINKLSHIHHQVLDIMLANPKMSTKDIAERVGLTSVYVNKLRRTPMFILAYDQQVKEVHDKFRNELVDEVAAATRDALAAMRDLLTNMDVEPSEKRKVAEMLFNGDTFSLFKGKDKPEKAPSVVVNTGGGQGSGQDLGLTAEMLAESRARRAEKYTVVDAEVEDVTDSTSNG